jgi:RNA polymerase sigma factor (sigma-70 family)
MPPPVEGFAARLVLGPALRTQPDRRLVTLVRDGYESAFEEIVRRYGKPLTRYAGAIVGGRAEDVTQDAFSKALLALRRDGAEIELRPWLFRIVRNTALNDLRDRPPTAEELAESLVGGGRSAAEEHERREELTDLMARLRSLPEPQRAAIVMRELEGLSHEEIAAALGLSGGGARQAIYRARQALRDGLGLLLPLPLLRLLIDHGGDAAAAGATAGGAATASGALGGVGAGMALKAGVVTAVLAGSVGTGIAVHEKNHGDRGDTAKAAPAPASARESGAAAPVANALHEGGSGQHGGVGHREAADLSPGHGNPSGGGHGHAASQGGRRHGPHNAPGPGPGRGPRKPGAGPRAHRHRGPVFDQGEPHGPRRGAHGGDSGERGPRLGSGAGEERPPRQPGDGSGSPRGPGPGGGEDPERHDGNGGGEALPPPPVKEGAEGGDGGDGPGSGPGRLDSSGSGSGEEVP